MNALIIYVCMVAGVNEFRDTPCVDRSTGPPAVGTIVEFPRYRIDRGGPGPGAGEGSTVYA